MARRSSKRCSASHRTSVARSDCDTQHQANSLLSEIRPGSSCTPLQVGTNRRETLKACCFKPMAGHARRHTPSPHSCARTALVTDATLLRAQLNEGALTHHLTPSRSMHVRPQHSFVHRRRRTSPASGTSMSTRVLDPFNLAGHSFMNQLVNLVVL